MFCLRKFLQKYFSNFLVLFMSVCKFWKFVITSPTFIDLYQRNSTLLNNRRSENPLFVVRQNVLDESCKETLSLCAYDGNNGQPLVKQCDIKIPLVSWQFYFQIIDSIDGLMLLSDSHSSYVHSHRFILYNPSIRKAFKLPKPNTIIYDHRISCTVGFGYEVKSNDFKVIRFASSGGSNSSTSTHQAEIFSLRSGRWRCIQGALPLCEVVGQCKQAFVNGSIHWIAETTEKRKTKAGETESCHVLAFDLGEEAFRRFQVPKSCEYASPLSVAKLGERLSVCAPQKPYAHAYRPDRYEIWQMEEHGAVGSWTKLYNIYPDRDGVEHGVARVVSFAMNDYGLWLEMEEEEHLREKKTTCLVAFDPTTRRITDLGVPSSPITFFVAEYVESLCLIGHQAER